MTPAERAHEAAVAKLLSTPKAKAIRRGVEAFDDSWLSHVNIVENGAGHRHVRDVRTIPLSWGLLWVSQARTAEAIAARVIALQVAAGELSTEAAARRVKRHAGRVRALVAEARREFGL